MIERLLRLGVRVYRVIDDSPPWVWMLASAGIGALAGGAFLEVTR